MPLPSTFIARLVEIFAPERILTDPADCWVYGYDNSKRQVLPEAVVFPTSHEQALALVRLCNDHEIPLTARGRGTGTTGATVPLKHGVVASFERMNRVLEFSSESSS